MTIAPPIPSHELAEALAEMTDMGQILRRLLDVTTTALEAHSGSIFLLDQGRPVQHILAFGGSFEEVDQFRIAAALDSGLAGWAVRHHQGALCRDTALDERWAHLGDESAAGSALAMPFERNGEVLLVLTLHHHEPMAFDDRHLAWVGSFANRSHWVLEGCLNRIRARRRGEEIRALIEALHTPALLLGEAGEIIEHNDAAAILLGSDPNIADDTWPRKLAETSASEAQPSEIRLAGHGFRAVVQPITGLGNLVVLEPGERESAA